MEEIPLLEFDHDKSALIEPNMVCKNMDLSEYCVMPFYSSVIEKLRKDGRLEKVCELGSVPVPKEVYKMEHDGRFVMIVVAFIIREFNIFNLKKNILILIKIRK